MEITHDNLDYSHTNMEAHKSKDGQDHHTSSYSKMFLNHPKFEHFSHKIDENLNRHNDSNVSRHQYDKLHKGI